MHAAIQYWPILRKIQQQCAEITSVTKTCKDIKLIMHLQAEIQKTKPSIAALSFNLQAIRNHFQIIFLAFKHGSAEVIIIFFSQAIIYTKKCTAINIIVSYLNLTQTLKFVIID